MSHLEFLSFGAQSGLIVYDKNLERIGSSFLVTAFTIPVIISGLFRLTSVVCCTVKFSDVLNLGRLKNSDGLFSDTFFVRN